MNSPASDQNHAALDAAQPTDDFLKSQAAGRDNRKATVIDGDDPPRLSRGIM